MMITRGYARPQLKKFIGAGACDDDAANARIDEVIDHLLREANWLCTVRRTMFYTCDSILTLPAEFDKILTASYCKSPVRVFNQYYEFLEGGPGRIDAWANTTTSDLVDLGMSYPIMRDIPEGERWAIAAFSTEDEDTNLTLTIRGTVQYNNNPLVDGAPFKTIPINRWDAGTEGAIKTLSSVQTSADEYKDIQQVIKPVTKGYVTLYAIDKSLATQTDDPMMYYLAKYRPTEERPSFRRYKIMCPNTRSTATAASSGNKLITMAKLKYLPTTHDNDILLIQDIQALKLGCMALTMLEANEFTAYKKRKDEAILLLHKQLADRGQESNEINVQMDAFAIGGSANII